MAEKNWALWTVVEPYWEADHASASIHVIASNFGNTGWIGQFDPNPGGYSAGHWYHGHVHYNWWYPETTTARRYRVACHEYGHAFGLGHGGGGGCMDTSGGIAAFAPTPSEHDAQQVNDQYLATGH